MGHQLGERVIRQGFSSWSLISQGDSMFSRSISTGNKSNGRNISTWLSGDSNHLSSPKVTYSVGDALLTHGVLGVECQATKPRLELLVVEVCQDVALSQGAVIPGTV